MRPEIVLARHGETEWSRDLRHTGRTDVPLTDEGRRQAAALRPRLAGRSFDKVLVSPLSRAVETCELVGLGERAGHRPNELSGGQQQRVAIARALINEPPILLADEPTGALDSRTGEEILALFKQLQQRGHTVVLITHDAGVAAHCDRVFVMRDGRMHEEGAA